GRAPPRPRVVDREVGSRRGRGGGRADRRSRLSFSRAGIRDPPDPHARRAAAARARSAGRDRAARSAGRGDRRDHAGAGAGGEGGGSLRRGRDPSAVGRGRARRHRPPDDRGARRMTETIDVVVNGERRPVAPDAPLLELLRSLALDPRAVVVEDAAGEIVTVTVRRVNLDRTKDEGILYHLGRKKYVLLANTAGCFTAQDPVRYGRLAREAGFNEFVNLEVIGDQETLLPDVQGLLDAARTLVREGFKVLAYTNEDLVTALRLEEVGCAAVMPLASPIEIGRASCREKID